MPWIPKFTRPDGATRFVHIDVDPLKRDFPMWGFATDVRLQADCATALTQVLHAVQAEADDDFRKRVAERMASWPQQQGERMKAVAAAAAHPGTAGALSAAFVCAAIGAAIDPEDIVVNEGIRNSPVVLSQIMRTLPGTLTGGAGGGLGYSGGMALGARLANPKVRAIQIVGDGGFHFSTPTSVYAVAQRYKLPIFTVVLDNGGWQAVKEAVLRVYPQGEAAGANEFQARLGGEQRRFDMVAQAFGAHGEYVTEPDQLPGAITRCLAALDAGRAAVLHVKVAGL